MASGDQVAERDDGHVGGRSQRRRGGRRASGDDQRRLQRRKLGGQARQFLRAAAGVAQVDDDVAAFDMPTLAQAVAQALQGTGEGGFVGHRQHCDPPRCPGRLRNGMRRRDSNAQRMGADHLQQGTSFHSITSQRLVTAAHAPATGFTL